MLTLLAVPAMLVVIATALPLLRVDHWWVRILDFPRAQIATGGVTMLALCAWFWDLDGVGEIVVVTLLTLAVAHQLVKIAPYTALMPKQVRWARPGADGATLRLLVANVLKDNRAAPAFLTIVRDFDPDVILTVETDRWWEQALRGLETEYPQTLKNPLDNTYGMLVHSRLQIIDPEIRFLLDDSIPSMHMQVPLRSGERVFLHFVHPDPPNPRYATETTGRDAELLIVGREVKRRDAPTIIAGDFNDVAWSHSTQLFQKASGLLDPRIGRGTFSTFDARNPLLRWPLDHVFHSDHFELVRMATGPAWGSDHFPIFIELKLLSGAAAEQQEPDTDSGEADEVDVQIEDGRR